MNNCKMILFLVPNRQILILFRISTLPKKYINYFFHGPIDMELTKDWREYMSDRFGIRKGKQIKMAT